MVNTTVLRPASALASDHFAGNALANDDLLPLLYEVAQRIGLPTDGLRSAVSAFDTDEPRIAVIANQRSHRSGGGRPAGNVHLKQDPNLLYAAPDTREEMVDTIQSLVREKIDLLVINGGDGTVRDVMSAAAALFGARMPPIGLLPSGKTNALANDLGLPTGWDFDAIRTAFRAGTITERAPVEIIYAGTDIPLRGFILGVGAFVRATVLAQRTHRMGAFDGTAVALSVLGGIAQTCMGQANNPWRSGETIGYWNHDLQSMADHRIYLLLMSTLRRFPLGLRPLGKDGDGLNVRVVDAPPRMLPIAAPAVLAGRSSPWLTRLGYHLLHDLPPAKIRLDNGFILDGELFPGGTMSIRAGSPLRFVVP